MKLATIERLLGTNKPATSAELADEYGILGTEIKVAEQRRSEIAAELEARGETRVAGDLYKLARVPETGDTKGREYVSIPALRAELGNAAEQFIRVGRGSHYFRATPVARRVKR